MKSELLPTNKRFGLFFATVFILLSSYFFIEDQILTAVGVFMLALITFALAILSPRLLYPFNFLWMKLGYVLGSIISPIVLGILFFGLITSVAICMRLSGRDELNLKWKDTKSHWKLRGAKSPDALSFKNQF